MTTNKKRVAATQARQAWRQLKHQRQVKQRRDNPRNVLTPPRFNEGDVADPADGTLNKDVIEARQGLTVLVDAWLNYGVTPGRPDDRLVLQWARGENPPEIDYEVADLQDYTPPIDPESFPKIVRVPEYLLAGDGLYQLRYSVRTWNGATTYSDPVPIRCDTTPPWRNEDPPKLGIPDGPILDAYLEENPNGVALEVPDCPDWQPGDRLVYWWLNGELPDDPEQLPPVAIVPVTALPMTVHVPEEIVRAAGDGGVHAVYLLMDKATNRSRLSIYVRLSVALGTLPANLLAPVVPQAADGLVSLDDANRGVNVTIPEFDHWKPTDRIEVTWGATVLPKEALGSAPGFPVAIRVPTAVLKAEYGYPGTEGSKTPAVCDRVLRGDETFDAPAIDVEVDFSTVGPDLPEWPDLVNPGLSAPRVFGKNSDVQDTLTRDDDGEAALLRFDLYAPAAQGEVIEFYWNGVHVPEETYTVSGEETAGDEIEVEIPWSYIAAAGNDPALPVHYRIKAPGSPNEQHSPSTQVNADAYTLTPPAPEFLRLTDAGYLTCESLDGPDHALLVQVPDLSEWLGAGDTVTVHYIALSGFDADLETPLADTAFEQACALGEPGFPKEGFIVRVQPYAKHVLPTYDPDGPGTNTGRARIHYVFTYKGEEIRSAREQRVVAMFAGNGGCVLDPPPEP